MTSLAPPLHASATPIDITADDGALIGATLYTPVARPVAAVLIAGAMGVPQNYYADFCQWLASEGVMALTFDYRGMGKSLHGHVRDVDADIVRWAADAASALRALKERTASAPVLWLGHSLGGQILPLVDGLQSVERVMTVATGAGYWRDNAAPTRRRVWLLWYFLVPALLPIVGYFPGRKLRMVGNLPRGVMAQWRRWCLNKDYMVGAEGEAMRERYAQFRVPITALSFSDDEMMSARNVSSMHDMYGSPEQQRLRIEPSQFGLASIGHFGFFRRDSGHVMWPRLVRPWLAGRRALIEV